jgi:Na+/proline symporter
MLATTKAGPSSTPHTGPSSTPHTMNDHKTSMANGPGRLGPSKRHWASMITTVVLTAFAFMLYYNIPPIAGTIYNSIVAFIGAIILTVSIVFLHKKDGVTFIDVVGLFVGLVMVAYHVSRLITGIC